MNKWEYLLIRVRMEKIATDDALIQALNVEGSAGWELVESFEAPFPPVSDPTVRDGRVFLFKRNPPVH